MITIVAKNIIHPDKIEIFKEMAQPLIEGSQNESGCLSYDLYQDIDQPEVLTFIESWVDRDAITAHTQTSHYTSIIPELTKLHAQPKEVRLYKKA